MEQVEPRLAAVIGVADAELFVRALCPPVGRPDSALAVELMLCDGDDPVAKDRLFLVLVVEFDPAYSAVSRFVDASRRTAPDDGVGLCIDGECEKIIILPGVDEKIQRVGGCDADPVVRREYNTLPGLPVVSRFSQSAGPAGDPNRS